MLAGLLHELVVIFVHKAEIVSLEKLLFACGFFCGA